MILTKAEENLMRHLWKIKKGTVKEITVLYEDSKPATTTILTLLKRLTDKNCVAYDKDSRYRNYYPLISKEKYFMQNMKELVKNFFSDSPKQFASFYAEKADLSKEDLESIKAIINSKIEEK